MAFALCRFFSRQNVRNAFFTALYSLISFHLICAERLPLRIYTTENGLAQNIVNRVVRDSHGYLWFCTEDGLSRFDGQNFVNYDMASGLPHPQVNHILEARDGSFWLATNGGGIVRFDISQKSKGEPRFVVVPIIASAEKALAANEVNYLYQDRSGTIWAGAFTGLLRLEKDGERDVFRRVALSPNDESASIRGFTEDENNNLWMWSRNGAYRRQPDGRIFHYAIDRSQNYDPLRGIFADQNGKIWIAHEQAGLFVLELSRLMQLECSEPADDCSIENLKSAIIVRYGKGKGLLEDSIFSLFQSSEKHLWIGTATGLTEFDGRDFHNYTALQGLPETPFNWLNEDLNGNIWATTNQGAVKLVRGGFVTFQQAEGLGIRGVRALWEDKNGELQVLTPTGTFHQFAGQNFALVKLRLPDNTTFEFPQNVILDSHNEIWTATKKGLFKFSPATENPSDLSTVPPEKIKGLPGDYIMNLYEDSQQNIWISLANAVPKLTCWERATNTLHFFTENEGVPADFTASAFAEDSSHTLWLGGFAGGVLRYRNGHFDSPITSSIVPFGQIQAMFFDRNNQLWIGTRGNGIVKVTEADSEQPIFSQLTTKDGISSNVVTSMIEDNWGRIYFGTGRGLDWLEPDSKQFGHYLTVDGLNDNKIEIAYRQRSGALWFGTANSLARFEPQPPSPSMFSPPVLITRLKIGENELPLAELGQSEIGGIEVGATDNQVVIDFASIDFAAGQTLRFQHKLVGAETEWSAPTLTRSVNFANLAPGNYEFLVQTVSLNGATGSAPAQVSFRILPPVYLRPWFLTLIFIVFAATTYSLYRYRLNKLLEIERTRTRIATDLHDDIGSDLSKISLLSEIVKMQLANDSMENNRLLTTIAEVSRRSVDSMRDIVWAINPKRDSLLEITRKMRELAEEIFVEKGVQVRFEAPVDGLQNKISLDVRREIYLIFKEAINNAARHSDCGRIEISLRLERRRIFLDVTDDGCGFENDREFTGNGLSNMKSRAEKVKGKFEVASIVGRGTTIKVCLPQN